MATKRPLVHCRVCKKEIDRDATEEGKDWIQPVKNWYYHPDCYENFAKKKQDIRNDIHADVDNSIWFDALYDYLLKDLKMSLNMQKVVSQWQHWLKSGYTAKGIYFTMRYFFEIAKGDTTKSDGIGIVKFLYQDACQYWVDRENEGSEIFRKIEAQVHYANNQKVVNVVKKVPKKDKDKDKYKIIDFTKIHEMGDDE